VLPRCLNQDVGSGLAQLSSPLFSGSPYTDLLTAHLTHQTKTRTTSLPYPSPVLSSTSLQVQDMLQVSLSRALRSSALE
jgi:hypothetical protein